MKRRQPPYSQCFRSVPETGVRVAIGTDAWNFAKRHHVPIMVLPEGGAPSSYDWPGDGRPALIYERGECNDKLLDKMAYELLRAGASSVVAIRETLMKSDPRVFYDREVRNVVE